MNTNRKRQNNLKTHKQEGKMISKTQKPLCFSAKTKRKNERPKRRDTQEGVHDYTSIWVHYNSVITQAGLSANPVSPSVFMATPETCLNII